MREGEVGGEQKHVKVETGGEKAGLGGLGTEWTQEELQRQISHSCTPSLI